MKIEKISESKQTKVKALIMGDSGSGKSYLMGTAPNPLIILTEPNGAMSILASNPDTKKVDANNLTDLFKILIALENDEIKETFETIVIDSLSALQKQFIDYIRKDKDTLTQLDYGKLSTQMDALIRRFIALPYHIVFTTLIKVEADEQQIRHMYPDLTGSMRYSVQQYFSGVGYLYQTGLRNEDGTSQRALLLDGQQNIKSKAFPNTTGILRDPNLAELFNSVCAFTNPPPPKPKRKRAPRKAKAQAQPKTAPQAPAKKDPWHGPSDSLFGGE